MTNTTSIEQMIEEAAKEHTKGSACFMDDGQIYSEQESFKEGANWAFANLDKHPDVIKLIAELEGIAALTAISFNEKFPGQCTFGDLVSIVDTDTKIAREALAEFNTKYPKTGEK